MNGGRVAQVGAPLEVYRRPASTFVASFLGNPPMNLLPATVTDAPGGRTLKVGASVLELPIEATPTLPAGRNVTFGIRPEHIGRTHPVGNGAAFCLDVEIQRIESLGAETIIVAELPGVTKSVFARFPGDADFRIGERRSLTLDLQQSHLFAEGGQAIRLA